MCVWGLNFDSLFPRFSDRLRTHLSLLGVLVVQFRIEFLGRT